MQPACWHLVNKVFKKLIRLLTVKGIALLKTVIPKSFHKYLFVCAKFVQVQIRTHDKCHIFIYR